MARKNNTIESVFNEVYNKVVKKYPYLNVGWAHCNLADKDHKKDTRVYCHTFHKELRDNRYIVCYSKAFFKLPPCNQIGIVWHEFGHILDYCINGKVDPSFPESSADLIIAKQFKVKIQYDKNHLEYV